MLFRLLAILPFLFGFPDLKANWTNPKLEAVRVSINGEDELLGRCIKSGLELRYRYEIRLCKRRPVWLDYCAEERVIRHSLDYDAISDKYTLVIDWHGDKEDPQTETYTTLEEAVDGLAVVKGVPMSFLSRGNLDLMTNHRRYLSIRAMSECKGDYNETMARIYSVLSLGMARISGFDTGWVNFGLNGSSAEEN